MVLFHVADILTYAEPLLWMGVLFAFLRSKSRHYFPALGFFLMLRVVCTPLLLFFLHAHSMWTADGQSFYAAYFVIYWISYLVGIGAIFFVIQEMFRYALAPLPGLSRLGLLGFRWAALSSLVVAVVATINTIPFHSGDMDWLIVGCLQLMRCVGVLELCLLAFLAVSIHTLGLSFRSRVFGLSLGFGMMAAMNFLTAVFLKPGPNMAVWVNEVGEIVLVGSLVTWLVYLAVPEPLRQPLMVPATSSLVRWNEIATALGHGTPQVALAPAGQFFLQDVEQVVDKILAKNSLNVAS